MEGGKNLTSTPHISCPLVGEITYRGDVLFPFLPWGSPRSSYFPPLRHFNIFIHLGRSLALSLPIPPTMKHKQPLVLLVPLSPTTSEAKKYQLKISTHFWHVLKRYSACSGTQFFSLLNWLVFKPQDEAALGFILPIKIKPAFPGLGWMHWARYSFSFEIRHYGSQISVWW